MWNEDLWQQSTLSNDWYLINRRPILRDLSDRIATGLLQFIFLVIINKLMPIKLNMVWNSIIQQLSGQFIQASKSLNQKDLISKELGWTYVQGFSSMWINS